MSQNQTESKPPSVEKPRNEGLDGTPCSRSFARMSKHALELECYRLDQLQRHMSECALAAGFESMAETIVAAKKYRAALEVIEERYVDGCDTYEDWKFMGDTARAFLSENAIGHAPGEKGTAND